MSVLTGRYAISRGSNDKVSNRALGTEDLKPTNIEEAISFFDGLCKIRVANELEMRKKAYELLYNNYSKMGIVQDKPGGLWLSIYDALPETTTIVADNGGQIEGALTLVFDSPIGLPADELYEEEINELRKAGKKICEIISFGINKTGNGSVKILASLFYSAYLLALRIRDFTDFVITVHANYENFYCRKLLFKKRGPVRHYAKVNGMPTIFLNLPLSLPEKLRDKQRIFPLYKLKYPEWKELEIAKRIEDMISPMSDREFYTFFIDKTDVWEKAKPTQKEYLKKISSADKTDYFSISRALAKGISIKLQDADNADRDYEV